MIESSSDFRLLGDRDYVNAGTLLNGFLDLLEREGARTVTVSRLKAHRTAHANGRLVLARNTALPDAEHAHCTFSASAGDAQWRGAFFDEGRPIGRSPTPNYSVRDVEASDFGGRGTIAPRGREALVFDLIQANRRFHELSAAPGEAGVVRFGYLENWNAPSSNVAFSGSIEATNLISRRTEAGILTINRMTYVPAHDTPVTLLMCFEIERAPRRAA
ncbi:MAG: hypothetical protein ACXW20_16375 [Burkholderiales bacterium]